jgi:hypothetical protein
MVKRVILVLLFVGAQSLCAKSCVVVKKEKTPSAATLQQEASVLVGEILQTSAQLVKDIGSIQTSCLASLKRVVEGEGGATKTKLSPEELKKCVDMLRSYNDSLKNLEEDVSSCCAFCSARL